MADAGWKQITLDRKIACSLFQTNFDDDLKIAGISAITKENQDKVKEVFAATQAWVEAGIARNVVLEDWRKLPDTQILMALRYTYKKQGLRPVPEDALDFAEMDRVRAKLDAAVAKLESTFDKKKKLESTYNIWFPHYTLPYYKKEK